jgi:hypothetical protein
MAVKGVNILEQHVEKIVLAVAAAGALYMGFLATRPVTIEGHDDIAVAEVESKLADEIAKVHQTRTTNEGVRVAVPQMDFASQYVRIVQQQPLPTALANAAVPSFGPKNMPIGAGGGPGPNDPTFKLVTPTPVPPESITAEVRQQPVLAALPSAGQPVTGELRDQNAVLLQGYIPVGTMQAEMARVRTPVNRLPDQLRRVSIAQIEVQRRERTANGWSDWQAVPAAKASPAPTEIDWKGYKESTADAGSAMTQVDAEFKTRVVPDFYPDDKGSPIVASNLTKPLPKPLESRRQQLAEEVAKANNQPVPGAPGRGFSVPLAPSPSPMAVPDDIELMNQNENGIPGEGTAAAPQISPSVAQLLSQPLIPFAFWDETVATERLYQYRVRVRYMNPAFNWQAGLQKPALKDQPLLDSEWVVVQQPVMVSPDVRFFVMNTGSLGSGGSTSRRVTVRVYKLTSGKWYWSEFDTQPGLGISGQIKLIDQQGKTVPVDLGYTVVDVVPAGNEAHVVLIDAAGKMITRDTATDRPDPENRRLFEQVVKPVVVTPPPAARGRGPARGPMPAAPDELLPGN